MPNVATLTFTPVANQWVSITTGNFMTTPTNFTVAASVQSGTSKVAVSEDQRTISITGSLDTLTIDVAGSLNPLALIFKQTVGSGDPHGTSAFGKTQTRGGSNSNRTISVKDTGASKTDYEFYVLVQDPNTLDVGLIDPKIVNT